MSSKTSILNDQAKEADKTTDSSKKKHTEDIKKTSSNAQDKPTVAKQPTSFFSVDQFIETERQRLGLSNMQIKGFRNYMVAQKHYYLFNAQDFYPYLKAYLGN